MNEVRFGFGRFAASGLWLLLVALSASAALHNGTFPLDTAGWTTVSTGSSGAPGDVTAVDEAAAFREGDSFLVLLRQDFTKVAADTTLSFRLAPEPGFDPDDVGFDDAFEVHLLDEHGASLVPAWREGATAMLSIQPNPPVPGDTDTDAPDSAVLHLGPAVTFDGDNGVFVVDLTGIADGARASLVFAQVGGNASTTSGFRLDDVLLPHDGNNPPTSVPG